jgi:hypothetical protein
VNFVDLKPDPLGDQDWARLRIVSKVRIQSGSSIDHAIEDIENLLIVAAGLHLLDLAPGLRVTSIIKTAWIVAANFECNRRNDFTDLVVDPPAPQEAILDVVLSCPARIRAGFHGNGYEEVAVFPRQIVQEVLNLWLISSGKTAARITDLIRTIATVSSASDLIGPERDAINRAVAALRRTVFMSV